MCRLRRSGRWFRRQFFSLGGIKKEYIEFKRTLFLLRSIQAGFPPDCTGQPLPQHLFVKPPPAHMHCPGHVEPVGRPHKTFMSTTLRGARGGEAAVLKARPGHTDKRPVAVRSRSPRYRCRSPPLLPGRLPRVDSLLFAFILLREGIQNLIQVFRLSGPRRVSKQDVIRSNILTIKPKKKNQTKHISFADTDCFWSSILRVYLFVNYFPNMNYKPQPRFNPRIHPPSSLLEATPRNRLTTKNIKCTSHIHTKLTHTNTHTCSQTSVLERPGSPTIWFSAKLLTEKMCLLPDKTPGLDAPRQPFVLVCTCLSGGGQGDSVFEQTASRSVSGTN